MCPRCKMAWLPILLTLAALFGYVYAVSCPQLCHCNNNTLTCTLHDVGTSEIPENTAHLVVTGKQMSEQCAPISQQKLQSLVSLSLEQTGIGAICSRNWAGLQSLQNLNLDHNKISDITADALSGLSNLLSLHMGHNSIASLPGAVFMSNPNLREIGLPSNQIDRIGCCTFSDLPALRTLDLSSNFITNIDANAFTRMNLTELNISSNHLRDVPTEALQHSNWIRTLDFSSNLFKVIRARAFSSFSVEELILNDLKDLQLIEEDAFFNLPDLRKIELRDNPTLGWIDLAAFSGAVGLSALSIGASQLISLPEAIIKPFATTLTSLDLRGCKFKCNCSNRWLTYENVTLTHFQCTSRKNGNASDKSCLSAVIFSIKDQRKEQFFCRARGVSVPVQIYWQLPNGHQLSTPSTFKNMHVDSIGTLTIYNSRSQESGKYRCVVELDESKVSASVVMEAKNNISLVERRVSANTITVSWVGSEIGTEVDWWDYILLVRQDNQEFHIITLKPFMRGYTITNLSPYHVYEFCIAVRRESQLEKLHCLKIRTKSGSSLPGFRSLGRLSILIALVIFFGIATFLLLASYMVRKHKQQRVHRDPLRRRTTLSPIEESMVMSRMDEGTENDEDHRSSRLHLLSSTPSAL